MAWHGSKTLLFALLMFFGVQAQHIPLHMERVFPESLYRSVYGKCTELWYQIRASNDGADTIVDSLVSIDHNVKGMTQERSHTPDDLEHLLGIVQLMHGEYVYGVFEKQPDEHSFHAVSYFFKRIKNRLEQLLSQAAT